MTDLTKLTVDELLNQIQGGRLYTGEVAANACVLELARRAQANDLVQAERDEFDEELHTCRAIVGATSEHLHVDLEEMVDKLRRTEADAHSWQELATARAQANDARVDFTGAAAPAPSSSGAPAPGHIAGVTKMVPVLYHLDDGKVAAAMLVAKNTIVVDLMSGDGPSVVGKEGWFEAGYVATYGGLVPEAADEGTEPGQWSYGVRQLPQFLAPAPADSQREAAIEAWIKEAFRCPTEQGRGLNSGLSMDTFVVTRGDINRATDLFRSAPPAPVDQDAKLRDAVAALETVATKQQKVELRDAAHRILQGYSPCMNCGKWARRSECHWPCNPIGKAPPAPVAPVTEGEVEAAIMDMFAKCKLYGWTDGREYPVAAESEAAVAARDALVALIARRVAEARGAGLREFKAWFAEKATWTIEATAEAPAVRGYSVAPRDIDTQIDRLLAAPPASKLAEEPAQEDDGPCLSALLANMRMEMSDGANGMRTPREEAIAAVVECVARRIEALENNKEAGK